MRQRVYQSDKLPNGRRLVTSYKIDEYIFIVLIGGIFNLAWTVTKAVLWQLPIAVLKGLWAGTKKLYQLCRK